MVLRLTSGIKSFVNFCANSNNVTVIRDCMTPPAASNPNCYAQHLCDCRGPVNGEHVVSRSLLEAIWQGEKGGRVHGLTFLRAAPDNPALMGIKALTAKILCTGHNSDLSPFDTEITKLFNAKERQLLGEIDGDPVGTNSYVSGDFIERWMLKTLCNGVFSGNFPVPFVNSFEGQLPPDECVRTIWRSAPLPTRHGVYVSHDSLPVNHENVFKLAVVGDPSGIVGLRMWMLGSLFTLVLTDDHAPFPELVTATYRPRKIVTRHSRNAVVFSWTGGQSGTVLEVNYSDLPTG
ncbi:MAG: hypothetical protein U0791_26085 [Gemmataceae bacterium]